MKKSTVATATDREQRTIYT